MVLVKIINFDKHSCMNENAHKDQRILWILSSFHECGQRKRTGTCVTLSKYTFTHKHHFSFIAQSEHTEKINAYRYPNEEHFGTPLMFLFLLLSTFRWKKKKYVDSKRVNNLLFLNIINNSCQNTIYNLDFVICVTWKIP